MTPLISVIVPIYNVEKVLRRSLESILAQTYSNLEIILVDDGSTDSSPQICDEYAQKDSRVKVVHQHNKGVAEARNTGLSMVTGDYIYFVDSDDHIEKNLCEILISKFEQTNAQIIVFDYFVEDDEGKLSESFENIEEKLLITEDALCELMESKKVASFLWNKMYKRSVFESVTFPSGRVWEDMAVGHKLFLNAESVYCMTQKLYYYCMRKGSIIHTISLNALCDIFHARYTSYIELIDEHPRGAELVFPRVALSALRLFDRSLWEKSDREEVKTAIDFLAENREKVLSVCSGFSFSLYYKAPALYRAMRKTKHHIGNVIKRIKK